MRVLRVIASVDPKDGGPIEGLRRTAAAMAELGHVTEVVTLDEPDAPYLADAPFAVHPQGRMIQKYGYTPKMARWVADNASRFDVAIFHGLWNHANIGGWQGIRKAGVPYVIFTHGMMDPWFRDISPLKHVAKQVFWLGVQGKVLRDAHAVLFTSEEERLRARNVFFGYDYTEKVVLYGAAPPPDDADAQRIAFRAACPTLGDRRYLLFLSRIHPKKGCDLLVEAFSSLAARYPDVDLVVAGPDQVGLAAELRAQAERAGIAGRIHWPGMLTGAAKWGAFRGAEAFILPSHQENFGIAVAEAMACGTPVLITNKINIWREVEAGAAGMIEDDTTEGTARLLKGFLNLSGDKRRAMGAAALAQYQRLFSLAGATRDLIRVLDEAIARSDVGSNAA